MGVDVDMNLEYRRAKAKTHKSIDIECATTKMEKEVGEKTHTYIDRI